MIQNASNPNANLKKKHIATSFHIVRGAIVAGIIEPWWLSGDSNLSDILIKQLPRDRFTWYCRTLYPSSAGSSLQTLDYIASKVERTTHT